MHDQGLARAHRLTAAVGHGGLDQVVLRASQILVVVASRDARLALVVEIDGAILHERGERALLVARPVRALVPQGDQILERVLFEFREAGRVSPAADVPLQLAAAQGRPVEIISLHLEGDLLAEEEVLLARGQLDLESARPVFLDGELVGEGLPEHVALHPVIPQARLGVQGQIAMEAAEST